MNIRISILLIHLYPILIYGIVWLIYRYIIHPDYRWHQEGNICYSNSYETSAIITFILSVLIGFLYHAKDMGIVFTW